MSLGKAHDPTATKPRSSAPGMEVVRLLSLLCCVTLPLKVMNHRARATGFTLQPFAGFSCLMGAINVRTFCWLPLGFKVSFSFPFLECLSLVLHILISFPGGVLQDEDKKQLILGSCLSSHFPSEKKPKRKGLPRTKFPI